MGHRRKMFKRQDRLEAAGLRSEEPSLEQRVRCLEEEFKALQLYIARHMTPGK